MDYKETQDAELEAVRAIFMDDFAEVESHTVWKSVNAIHEFTINVHPMEDELKESVSVTLHFKLPKTYPKIAPQMVIDKQQGLSAAQIEALQACLRDATKLLMGTEMVYELVTTASAFITENNTVVRFSRLTSLDADRARRAEEAEQVAANQALLSMQAQQEQDRLRLQDEIEADNRRREQLREQRMRADREASVAPVLDDGTLAVTEQFEKPLQLPGNIQATTVIRGMLIGQCEGLSLAPFRRCDADMWTLAMLGTLYHAEAVASTRHGVRLPATLHIIDIHAPYFLTSIGQKKLERVDEELQTAVELRHHNILTTYGFRRRKISDTVSQGWRYSIVTEPLPRNTLHQLIMDVGELRLPRALPYFLDIAAGIQHLHSCRLVHRTLNCKNVYVGRSETGELLVKLTCGSWLRQLMDINRSNSFAEVDEPRVPEHWLSPNLIHNPLSVDKTQDLWDFGVLMVQVIYGADALFRYPTPMSLIVEVKGTSLGHLLAQLFERKHINATTLVERLRDLNLDDERSFSKGSLAPAESLPSFALSQAFSPPQQMFLQEQSGLFFQPRAIAVSSRYRSEFEEVEKLGQGGFGQVVKARNKLDNNFYAIKKVRLPHDTSLETKILREVTIWGRLSHPGIVRYHTSWVETDSTSTGARQALGMLNSNSFTPLTDSFETDEQHDSDDTASEGNGTDSDDETASEGHSEGEVDFDLGFDDLDFISTGHQSKSLSMPTIHFGEEDDPSNEPSRVTTRTGTPELMQSQVIAPAPSPKQTRTLFIQMEFVSGQTLREQIDEGITEDEMWRILRQILNAMRYFTSFNIIHRDMKPSNILLDASSNVRIADFGLAVEQNAPDSIANMSAEAFNPSSDLTSGVGTSLYLAPETMERRKANDKSNRYTDKIDMYSLGIIIFEMCWPIKTRMERIEILKALRRPEIVFPSGWDESDPKRARQGKIIRWCLSHDPVKRAGPLDLLRSDLLPAAVQDEYITDALALIAQPNSPHIQTVLNALFHARSDDKRAQDLAFDVELEDSELNNPYDSIVKRKLEHLFQLRGAVDFSPPLLMPSSDLYDEKSRRPVRLLNRQGVPVQLPYDLVLPLARFVARDDSISRLKRYNISPVYREDRMGGQPRAFLAASYDLISKHQTMAAEAECIQAIDDILTEMTGDEAFVHVIGHHDFVACLLESLAPHKQAIARRALERYELLSSPWSQVIGEMAKLGLSRRSLDDLAALDICDELPQVEDRIRSLSPTLAGKLRQPLQQVKQIVQLCTSLGVARRILVSPLLCFKPELHVGGVCFQSRIQKARRRDVYAEGGRYNRLVETLATPGARLVERSLVGVTVAVSKLSHSMASRISARIRPGAELEKIPRRCDIFIVSYNPGLIEARLVLAHELWKQQLSADLMYDDDFAKLGPDRITATVRKEGIHYMVVVKHNNSARDTVVKVKDLATNNEREVYRHDLPGYLADRLNSDQTQHIASDTVVSHGHRNALPFEESLDAHLSLPADTMKRMKHKQKQIILDKAADCIQETLSSVTNIPLFAVDAEGEAFRLMSESCIWITRDEHGQAVRKIVEAAPASKKAYILDLRDELRDYHEKNHCRWMWLYSLKETKANLLSFV